MGYLLIQGRELEKYKVRGGTFGDCKLGCSHTIVDLRKRAKLILLLPKHQVRETSGMAGREL
ncbi:unnamed protein product [Clonostachys chloroleuca]|uniref:Uncharacterized protein n=1 Tax=Clonostachys chloroleuca TaxID=1926264 RepID=A0AA35MC41_9HYPO|nr:unnamed protein product [Clonostachys chloroleuca]